MTKSSYLLLSISFLILALSGCGQMHLRQQAEGTYQALKSDAWIEILKEITVPAEQARVFLQNGDVIKQDTLNLYTANCELKLQQLLPTEQIIQPGRYRITSTTAEESSIVFTPGQPRPSYAANIRLAHTPADVKRFWRFKLNSTQSPKVTEMICRGIQDFPSDAQLPTLLEMQNSVGNYVKLHFL